MADFVLFPHPDPCRDAPKTRILPVFLPLAGCPGRCLYCDQRLTSGDPVRPLTQALDRLGRDLAGLDPASPLELAFFGGTFTALPSDWTERFLSLAAEHKRRGALSRIRCSTRPDAVTPDMLARLRNMGLNMVELGVQSFDDGVLTASGRGYSGETALRACEMVRDAGLELGVQLLPGLPGDREDVFQQDVKQTAALAPEGVRLYPCQVLEGTELAALHRAGKYEPWTLERTVDELARAVRVLWGSGIPVIRMGLAPEPDMRAATVAGPWHPALGQRVRSRVLLAHVRTLARNLGTPPRTLFYPARDSGEIMGHGGELSEEWKALLGGEPTPWDGDRFLLR